VNCSVEFGYGVVQDGVDKVIEQRALRFDPPLERIVVELRLRAALETFRHHLAATALRALRDINQL
jgi:hypothetical protein